MSTDQSKLGGDADKLSPLHDLHNGSAEDNSDYPDPAERLRQLEKQIAELQEKNARLQVSWDNSRDVSDLQKAESAAQERLKLFQTLLEAMPDAVYLKDKDGHIIIANEAICRHFGFSSQSEIIGKTDHDLHPKDEADIYRQEELDIMEGKIPLLNLKNFFKDKQDSQRVILKSKFPYLDTQGNVTGILGINRDITDLIEARHQAEGQLAILKTALDALPDSFYVKDIDSRFIMVNKHLCQLCYLPEKELLGKSDKDFCTPQMADDYRRDELEVMRTLKPIVDKEERTIFPDGTSMWLLTTKVPYIDSHGQVAGIMGVTQDITSLKQAEENASTQRDLLQKVLDCLPEAIYLKDTESRFILLNKTLQEWTGNSSKELLIGKNDEELFSPQQADIYRQEELNIISDGKPLINKEESFIINDKIRHILTTKLPYFDATGKITGILGVSRDITDIKVVQQEAADRLELLHTLIESLPDMICLKDLNHKIAFANGTYAKRFGLSDPTVLIGTDDYDFHPPEEADIYVAEEKRMIETGMPLFNVSNSYWDSNGQKHELLKSKIPYRDHDGAIVGILGINRDITELKNLQEEAEERLKLLQTVIDALPDAIYLKDNDSRFILGNKDLCRALGVESINEIIGKTDFDFNSSDLATKFKAEEMKIMDSDCPIINQEEWHQASDGTKTYIFRTKIPYRDTAGNVIGTLGINRDVTELQKVREELNQKLALLQMLIDHIPDYIYIKDLDSRILMANKSAVRGAGFKKMEDFVGRTDHDNFPADVADKLLAEEQRVLKQGHMETFLNECYDKSSQQHQIILTTKIPLRDIAGNLIGLVGIGRDITEVKKQETMLVRTEKLAAVGTLAAGTAHQFNNLLAIIMGTVEMVLGDPSLSGKCREYLNTTMEASKKANVIVKDLLTFARQKKPIHQLSSLNQVLEQTIRILEYEYKNDRISLEKDLRDIPDYLMDPDKLSHVFMNLLVNAQHALAGITDKKVKVTSKYENGRIAVLIQDNGCGISREHMGSIFDPFFTTKGASAQGSTPQAKINGTGLGLSVCNSIIQEHGGTIEVTSEADAGTTFTVSFLIQSPNRPLQAISASGKILVVDDELLVRKVVTEVLSRKGFLIEQASNGQEGLEMILKGRFEAVVTDLSMPVMGGIEMIQKMNENMPVSERPAMVVVSGYVGDHENLLKSLDVAAIVDKPFTSEDLYQGVSAATVHFQKRQKSRLSS